MPGDAVPPTERELEILKVLWDRGEGSVREVFEAMSAGAAAGAGIVQNTVQAFLRTMEEKGLVRHRVEGRTFIYQAVRRRAGAGRRVVAGGAGWGVGGGVDQAGGGAVSLGAPSAAGGGGGGG